jgi:hypothetical protein
MKEPSIFRRLSTTALRAIGVWVALAIWTTGVVLVGGSLLSRHLLPLPPGARDASALLALAPASQQGGFVAFHVLYTDCRCSRRIADTLIGTARPADVAEHVLLVGTDDDLSKALSEKGFHVHAVTSDELDRRFQIPSAPLFVLVDPTGRATYSGGYTDRKQALASHDRDIVEAARAGHRTPAFPVYGCAVAERLQRERNPLGIP